MLIESNQTCQRYYKYEIAAHLLADYLMTIALLFCFDFCTVDGYVFNRTAYVYTTLTRSERLLNFYDRENSSDTLLNYILAW